MHVPVAAVAAVALMKVFGCAWYSWCILGYLGIFQLGLPWVRQEMYRLLHQSVNPGSMAPPRWRLPGGSETAGAACQGDIDP